MRLKSFQFAQHRGRPTEWTLERMDIGSATLIVGRNATGKSKTMAVIRRLASLVAGGDVNYLGSAEFSALFDDAGKEARYELSYDGNAVVHESYSIDGRPLLRRGKGGVGKIFAEKQGINLDFQATQQKTAVFTRLDEIQHPFLKSLSEWGSSLMFFEFGTKLGKDQLTFVVKDSGGAEPDWRDSTLVAPMLREGLAEFSDRYKSAILKDMGALGYDLTDVGVDAPTSVLVKTNIPGEVVTVFVQERALAAKTDQHDMSQGMFRALSLLIQVNYAVCKAHPSCVLIDDIGEGLDFERSRALINVLLEKASKEDIQLVMTTNDRFVMNAVPLEAWTVLQREGGHVRPRNYANSKSQFDKFRLTGMNNFDFLATDFLSEAESLDF